MPFTFRGSDPADDFDARYNAPIRRFATMDDITWAEFEPGSKTRIIVQPDPETLPVDLLYIPQKSDTLLVGIHGAAGRKNLDIPKFQFVRTFTTRGHSTLFVSDSTLLQNPVINIGWLTGNKDVPLYSLVAQAVRDAGDSLGVEQTILAGHSAGGFASVLVGSQVPNSRAVSVNGQSVVSRYIGFTKKNLHKAAFPECETQEEMFERYADRLDLRVAIKSRLESSSFSFFGNVKDKASFGDMPHFPLFAEHFGLTEEGGRTDHGDAFVACTWHLEKGGHALPGTILPFIDLTLGRKPSVEITTDIDPRWYRESAGVSVE